MEFLLVAILIALLVGGFVWWRREKAAREARSLADVRADAQRWYERLGGQVMNLHGDDPAVRQALVDAGERYNAAGSQLEQARTVHQFRLARETALEGLAYARAARVALGLDPGPELPPLAAAQGAGEITRERQVDVQGQTFRAGPQPGRDTPYYYPGGRYQGRPVPAGWYSTPWWKTALGAGVGVVGGMLIADALFSPAFADPGYDAGYQEGFGDGADFGGDFGTAGDAGGGDFGTAGDFGGGGFGGGDFGGGDFGGGGDF
ncbi:hypothetical protein [Micromonospora sp. RL09-050-HVF-A]|uniref:hypothetical protein n=1 Tax=Micromonospora sp. RL09-050-HVF-A TaxID=1703433 RepID=UPI001C5ED3C7|nr:hypothetical protein [Micromonospora sp. RL09-050-HVF-A]MBW4704883.1 hypothetical protein [Micromonospora sp. RL09-050-HVF-A]